MNWKKATTSLAKESGDTTNLTTINNTASKKATQTFLLSLQSRSLHDLYLTLFQPFLTTQVSCQEHSDWRNLQLQEPKYTFQPHVWIVFTFNTSAICWNINAPSMKSPISLYITSKLQGQWRLALDCIQIGS